MKKAVNWKNFPISVILAVFALLCILPFWLVLAGSLTGEEEIMSCGYSLFPRKVDFTAYRILLNDMGRILSGYKISIIVTVLGTALSVFVVTLAAWPISQERVKYHSFLNFFVLFTMLFNGGMVPWFIVCRNMLHLTDSIWALILPYLANAWYIFLVRNYYKGIPNELVEAAKIDGAGEYRIFFRIVFPLAKPVVATISLFACLNYWNDWWLGIMLIDNVEVQPLQLLLRTITSNIQFLSSAGNSMNYHMLTFDLNASDVTLEPIEQTEMFKEAVTWMKKWYDEGIVSKNELSETDTKMFENGKTFAKVGLMETAQQGVTFNVDGAEYGWADLYPDGKYRKDSPLNNAFAINKNAANPERLLMLLELLKTDEEAYDMFMYGVEGETYVKDETGALQYPEGQDAATSTYLGWFN